jgi:predicted Zn finger-like uncharacterized protein
MDVTCTRCSTVYEIEEGTVSPSGMTVKCTQCGHLFKVRGPARPSDPPAASPSGRPRRSSSEVAAKWRVKRADGSTHALESLAELSRAIVEGRFEDTDEISGTGQAWKKLGDIAELSILFGGRERPSNSSQRPVAAVLPAARMDRDGNRDINRDNNAPAAMPLPPPPSNTQRPRKNTPFPEPEFNIMGLPVSSEGVSPFGGGPMPPPPRPSAPSVSTAPRVRSRVTTPIPAGYEVQGSPAPAPVTASQPIAGQQAGAGPSPLAPAAAASFPPAQPALAGAAELPNDFGSPPRAARSYLWIAIVVPLFLIAGVVGALLLRKPWMVVVEAPPAREFLLRADEALAAHRQSRFEEAASEYTKALAFHEDDAHILSSLSRVYAVWSQLLRSRAEGMRARGEGGEVELTRLANESERLAELAKAQGERAAQRNPGNVEAEVALSDALRLTGNSVAARAELDRARHAEPVASAETLRVAAWLAIDEAHGDMKAGKALAQQAVEQDPKLLRARFLLIDCLLAEQDLDGARLHLDAIRSIAPDHPLLLELSRALDRASRPAPDAGAPSAVETPARADAAAPSKPDAQARDAKGRGDDQGVVVSPEAAADLVKRGEHALEDGSVRAAQELFEEALTLAPRFPPALTGLGYVALERGQIQIALRRFLPAAKVGYGEALIGLGDTYRRVGRSEEALEAYQTYVRRFPRGTRRSIAQRQIELLREQLAGDGTP